MNNFFWRAYAALAVLFVLFIICLATAFVLMRRLIKRVASNTAGLRSERDHTANHKAGPGADPGGAGREGVSE